MTEQRRRTFLGALGTVAGIGLAGCTGNGDGGGGDSGFPPNVVTTWSTSDTGSSYDFTSRTWMHYAQNYYPDGVKTTVTVRDTARGIPAFNELYNDAENFHDGSVLGHYVAGSAGLFFLTNDEVQFDIREFRPLAQDYQVQRAIALNPRVTPIEGHYEMTYDEIMDWVVERYEQEGMPFRLPHANEEQRMLATTIMKEDPRLNEENVNLIEVPGGGEARSAHERGELDAYLGSVTAALGPHEPFYKSQVAMVNPADSPGYVEAVKEVASQSSDLREEGDAVFTEEYCVTESEVMPAESAQLCVNISTGGSVYYLPPDTPDEVYDWHVDALSNLPDDENFNNEMRGFATIRHQPEIGEPIMLHENAVSLYFENPEFQELVLEIYGRDEPANQPES